MSNNQMFLSDHLHKVMKDERKSYLDVDQSDQMARGEAMLKFASKFANEISRILINCGLLQVAGYNVKEIFRLGTVADRLVSNLRINGAMPTEECDRDFDTITNHKV